MYEGRVDHSGDIDTSDTDSGTYIAHELERVIPLHTVAAVEHEEELQ